MKLSVTNLISRDVTSNQPGGLPKLPTLKLDIRNEEMDAYPARQLEIEVEPEEALLIRDLLEELGGVFHGLSTGEVDRDDWEIHLKFELFNLKRHLVTGGKGIALAIRVEGVLIAQIPLPVPLEIKAALYISHLVGLLAAILPSGAPTVTEGSLCYMVDFDLGNRCSIIC